MIKLKADNHELAAICLNPGASGEPVVLLHGITSSIAFWQVNPPPYLLEIGPCYSLSLPAHYPALAPRDFGVPELTAEAVVAPLDDAIRQLVGEQPVTLIGHSTGGFAALALAARRPEMARRVVSIAGFAHGRWTGVLGGYQQAVQLGWSGVAYYKTMFRLLKIHPRLYRWAMSFYVANTQGLYANPDLPEALALTYPPYQQLDLNALLPYFKHMPEIDIMAQLPRIQAQALIVVGDCDPIVPPEQSYQIAEQIEAAELVIMEGAGHLPFLEHPTDYHASVCTWLKRAP